MELKKHVCPNCGADIRVDDPSKPVKCSYCGGVFFVDGASEKAAPTVDKSFEELKKGVLHDMSHGEEAPSAPYPHVEGKVANPMSVVALVLSIFSPFTFLGLIFGIIGLKKSKECGGKGYRLSKIAIGISIVELTIAFLAYLGSR